MCRFGARGQRWVASIAMAGQLELLVTDVSPDEIGRMLGASTVTVPLPGGPALTVVPISDEVSMATDATEIIYGFELLTGGVVRRARQLSQRGRVLYLHVEFFGGIGFHAVLGWRGGEPVLGPLFTANHEAALQHEGYVLLAESDRAGMAANIGLRFLGVTAAPGLDEFATVGLDAHPWTAEWTARASPP